MVEADPSGTEPTPPKTEGPTDLEKKIIRQIEYYFGDINLARDKFMQEQIKLDDGWIPMETMLKFNRLSQLTKDTDVIVKALQKSTSELMEISEDNTKIRRSPNKPLPEMNEDRRKELMKRTVYCKGFPLEGTTIHQLLEFFPKFGQIDNVVMRSYNDKATKTWKFKGSVFIIFANVDEAKKFTELESVKYNDTELIRKFQADYIEEKRKERLEKIALKKKEKAKNKGKKDDEEGKKEGDEEKKEEDNGNEAKADEGEGDGDEEGDGEEDDEKEDKEFPRDSVVHLKGLSDTEVSREDIKAAIEELGIGVAFIDFMKGQDEAWVRLDSKGAAIEVASRVKEGKLTINENVSAELRVVEGEEEIAFLVKAKDDKRKHMQRNRHKGRRDGRRGRGGFRGRKRRGSPGRGGPKNKAQKTDG